MQNLWQYFLCWCITSVYRTYIFSVEASLGLAAGKYFTKQESRKVNVDHTNSTDTLSLCNNLHHIHTLHLYHRDFHLSSWPGMSLIYLHITSHSRHSAILHGHFCQIPELTFDYTLLRLAQIVVNILHIILLLWLAYNKTSALFSSYIDTYIIHNGCSTYSICYAQWHHICSQIEHQEITNHIYGELEMSVPTILTAVQ